MFQVDVGKPADNQTDGRIDHFADESIALLVEEAAFRVVSAGIKRRDGGFLDIRLIQAGTARGEGSNRYRREILNQENFAAAVIAAQAWNAVFVFRFDVALKTMSRLDNVRVSRKELRRGVLFHDLPSGLRPCANLSGGKELLIYIPYPAINRLWLRGGDARGGTPS